MTYCMMYTTLQDNLHRPLYTTTPFPGYEELDSGQHATPKRGTRTRTGCGLGHCDDERERERCCDKAPSSFKVALAAVKSMKHPTFDSGTFLG